MASLCLLASFAPARAAAASCTDEFTGASGGSWSAASNWSAGVPGAGTVVCWDAAKTVLVDEGAQIADSVAAGGGLDVAGSGTLDLTAADGAPSSLSGQVRSGEGGTLELHGRLACPTASAEGGEIRVEGTIECSVLVTGGGRVSGVGNVRGAVYNESGTVEPGDVDTPVTGALSVGEYVQGSDGTLAVQHEQAPSPEVPDHLAAGRAVLAGTLWVRVGPQSVKGLAVSSSSEPEGYFAHLAGPASSSSWTVGYGQQGAAVFPAGGLPFQAALSGPAQAYGELGCGMTSGEPAAGWLPRGFTSYAWSAVRPPARTGAATGAFGTGSGLLAELLAEELAADEGPGLIVPGAAVGRQLECRITVAMPVSGGANPQLLGGASAPLTIGGPYRNIAAPAIRGTPAPGSRLTCSPGRWEGTPGSYGYAWWTTARHALAEGPSYVLRRTDEGTTLACIVTADYGGILVPAEASLQIPRRPQPTLCPRRPVALVSGQVAAGEVLLAGAAEQRFIGARVNAFRQSGPQGAWRRVGAGRVNGSGYFTVRVRGRGGRYRVAVGRTPSNAVAVPGVLQIVSAGSRPGESLVDLRISPAAQGRATVTVALMSGCKAVRTIAAAQLSPGSDLRLRLSAERGTGAAAYLARASVAGRTYSVELIVPPLPT